MANNELGDFQTNQRLADAVVALVSDISQPPKTIIEPTCGRGNFIDAALRAFPDAIVHGLEIQNEHVRELERRFQFSPHVVLHRENYFDFDWPDLVREVAKPLWVVGNPPWVTNTFLVKADSRNLPIKSPQAHLRGIEAQTGKSNFDISESMLRDWFGWCGSCGGTLSVICKMSVARKVLKWWWLRAEHPPEARIHLIDAKAEFGAAVSACVLVCTFGGVHNKKTCDVYETLESRKPGATFGEIDGHLVADAAQYSQGRHFLGSPPVRWRSGIKHDAAQILELRVEAGELLNKSGHRVSVEKNCLFPMLKGSDLGSTRAAGKRMMLVPQRFIGEDTSRLEREAPDAWAYLSAHADTFRDRKSIIYKKGGPFSIFGVGDYSFLPWKIAIGALYKRLDFQLVGPIDQLPVVFDDTVYFQGFSSEAEARKALESLSRPAVISFLDSMIFWDDMRPIKTEILNRLDLRTGAHREQDVRTE